LSRTTTAAGGIVRPARRPQGWVAPGPLPTGGDDPELAPRAGEDLCFLSGEWRILQRIDGHRWSLDDLATAHYAARAMLDLGRGEPATFADLGCGIGTVALLLAWRFPSARGIGIEAQAVSVSLARRSVRWNGVADRVEIIEGDLRGPRAWAGERVFDLVTGTPPYLPSGTASESDRIQRGPCRIERRGGIEDYCRAARELLAPRGRFIACVGGPGPERGAAAARAAGLAVDRCRPVVPRSGKAPLFWLFRFALRVCTVGAVVEPPLVVRDARGRRTEEFAALRADMGMPP
jgi:tRNA1(Val) A37 N6-methylase TrmN6